MQTIRNGLWLVSGQKKASYMSLKKKVIFLNESESDRFCSCALNFETFRVHG